MFKNERKGKIKKEIASKYYRVFIKMLEKNYIKKTSKKSKHLKKNIYVKCASLLNNLMSE